MPDASKADPNAESVVVQTGDPEAARLAELYLTPAEYAPVDGRARDWADRVRARVGVASAAVPGPQERERLRQQARLALAATSGRYVWARVRRPFREGGGDAPLLALMEAHLRVKRLWGVESDAEADAREAARLWEGTFRLWNEAERVVKRERGASKKDDAPAFDSEAAAAATVAGAAAGAPTLFTMVPGGIQKRMGRLALRVVRRRPFILGGVGLAVLAVALTPWFVEAWSFADAYADGHGRPPSA